MQVDATTTAAPSYFWGPIPGASVTAPASVASPGPGQVHVAVRDTADNLVLWDSNLGGPIPTNLGPAPTPAGSSIGLAPLSATTSILYARSPQGALLARAIAP